MTTERVLFEAELLIAPPKCRATMLHVTERNRTFAAHAGRPLSAETVGALIMGALVHYGADESDVQWFIDLELMPESFMAEWRAAVGS